MGDIEKRLQGDFVFNNNFLYGGDVLYKEALNLLKNSKDAFKQESEFYYSNTYTLITRIISKKKGQLLPIFQCDFLKNENGLFYSFQFNKSGKITKYKIKEVGEERYKQLVKKYVKK